MVSLLAYSAVLMNHDSNITLLTPAEAATRLGISTRTVWAMCRSGALNHLRYSARCIRIRLSDIERFHRKCARK